jgi:hypothetical protein
MKNGGRVERLVVNSQLILLIGCFGALPQDPFVLPDGLSFLFLR